jgi:acetyl esterase/lipase
VIFFHGGGFVAGDKSKAPGAMITGCLERGMAFASANYRFVRTDPFPAPMQDGARVLQFLRHNAAEWNLDPDRVAVFGGSAGAGMSMWLAYHDDLADPGSPDPVLQQSSRVTCAAALGGQSSYDPRVIREWIGGRAHEHPSLLPFYGMTTPEQAEEARFQALFEEASAITHLSADDPPVYAFYSEPAGRLPDNARPGQGIHHPAFGLRLREAAQPLGLTVVYRHRTDPGLGNPHAEMLDFFAEHLRVREGDQ